MKTIGQFYHRVNAAPKWVGNVVHHIRNIWEKANENYYNIATTPENQRMRKSKSVKRQEFSKNLYLDESEVNLRKNEDNNPYGVGDYYYVRKIRRLLKLNKEDVVYDIGCGMGRILCVFAQHPVRRCVGVELSRDLCDISEENARQMRGKKCDIDIICDDVTSVDLSDGTVFVLFNPFGDQTMKMFLDNLHESIVKSPRDVRFAYYNDQQREVFKEQDWLVETSSFYTLNGLRISFWKNVRS